MPLGTPAQAQTPCEADEQRRAGVMERIGAVVAEGLQDGAELHVQPYGSFVSGLYTPSGDLDIALEGFVHHGCAARPFPSNSCIQLCDEYQGPHALWMCCYVFRTSR